MTIHLPQDLESSIQAAVRGGHFASVDEAMTAAARMLLQTINQENAPPPDDQAAAAGLGSIGAMRDAADELDEAMAHAMNLRRQPWRIPPSE